MSAVSTALPLDAANARLARVASPSPAQRAPHVDEAGARAKDVVAQRAAEIALAAKLRRERLRAFALAVLPPILGLTLFVVVWSALAGAPDSRLP